MNKSFIYLFFIFILIFSTSCSFDNKSGIWKGHEDDKRRASELEKEQNREILKIYSSEKFFSTEIAPVIKNKLTLPEKNSSWKMSGLNLQNHKGNIYLSGIEKKFIKKKIGKNKFSELKIKSSPLIYNNYIIFSDDTGSIYKLDNNGKKIWKINIYRKVYKKIYKNLSMTIKNDNLYVADNVGFIYVINLDFGKVNWIKNHGIPLKSNIKIFENKIYLINQDNRILCLNSANGSIVWDIRTSKSFIKSQNLLSFAISENGDLLALNSSGDLLKIKASNGRIYWSLNVVTFTFFQDVDFFVSSEIVINKEEIIFSSMESVFSFNLKNGYLNWKQEINSKNTPIIDGSNIFLVSDNGYFINLDRKTGKIIWSVNIFKILKKKKRKTVVTGFIMGSGKIYVTTLNGYLIVCSATSGVIESIKKIGDQLIAKPIISNGSLYILTQNSRLFGFR